MAELRNIFFAISLGLWIIVAILGLFTDWVFWSKWSFFSGSIASLIWAGSTGIIYVYWSKIIKIIKNFKIEKSEEENKT